MMLLMLAGALYVGNKACEPCHQELARSYRETPMARSSGRVSGGLEPGSVRHNLSSAGYEIKDSGVVDVTTGSNNGRWNLDYFIGSGATGRSFLYSTGGFLFQAPVTWYSQQSRWGVSPGYENDRISRWNRPIEPACLGCHSSQVRFAKGYQNRYADPPFAQDGIGCERCHGPGSEHIAGKGSMILPSGLAAEKRDSVCAQCHMSGEARVAKLGRSFLDYRAGQTLQDYVSYFVYAEENGVKATSYVEKLAASRCKLQSGDRLWCGSCHDPHRVPSALEKVAWYRSKCETCHVARECERGPDCAACHMPRSQVQDVAHGMLTDHEIAKIPYIPQDRKRQDWRLQAFPPSQANNRELGLAYAEVSSQTGDSRQRDEAFRLLSPLLAASKRLKDQDVEVRLASLYQQRGDAAKAAELYEALLASDPDSIVSLVNLGNFYGSRGELAKAAGMWRHALTRNPCQAESAANLKQVYAATGETEKARVLDLSQEHCAITQQ